MFYMVTLVSVPLFVKLVQHCRACCEVCSDTSVLLTVLPHRNTLQIFLSERDFDLTRRIIHDMYVCTCTSGKCMGTINIKV